MKIFHTADWHLGKLVQGVYMTDDQAYILEQFIQQIKQEKPDVIIIAGDLYDRAVPPTEAVHLLNETLREIVLHLEIPTLAIAGNHDSPSRIQFGSEMMEANGLHIVGEVSSERKPIVLKDQYGEVHFHLVPYTDPSTVRNVLADDEIRSHDDAMRKIIAQIKKTMDPNARHVFIGHAFVTPYGQAEENTSESERPLQVGGAEYVNSAHFECFSYTALGHLHQAHKVINNHVRYAGSILKYSISEENHKKGYLHIDLDESGEVTVNKRELVPRRDMRTVEGTLEDILQLPPSEDYVFARLVDETPILSPMEKIRALFPNALHVERKNYFMSNQTEVDQLEERSKMSDLDLFRAFYKEVKGLEVTTEAENIFTEVLNEQLKEDNETLINPGVKQRGD